MRNSQLAALCAVILLAAAIVAGTNLMLAHQTAANVASARVQPTARPITIAMMPKSKGNSYFIAARKGAQEAASELGVNLIWDGPTTTDALQQNQIIEQWTTRGVDAIAVAVENAQSLSQPLREARARGIKVITYDSDSQPDARDFFVNQATTADIGNSLMDNAARLLGGKGHFAIISGSLTAQNMIDWQNAIEARRAAKYPDMKMVVLRACDDKQDKAQSEATAILNAYPDVKLIMAICSPAVPGAAEAVKQSGRTDVKVMGLGLPNENKKYVHAGITQCVILWKTVDLGYLTVYAAHAAVTGALQPDSPSLKAGRLGRVAVKDRMILLGPPFVFTKENIDDFDF